MTGSGWTEVYTPKLRLRFNDGWYDKYYFW